MSLFTDTHEIRAALLPQAVSTSGSAAGVWVDTSGADGFCFAVTLGAVEAGKSVKAELLSSAQAEGGDPKTEGSVTFTAPEGGAENHVICICGAVSPLRGRYLSVKVTNVDGESAVQAGAAAILEQRYRPPETDGTLLVV